MLPGRLPVSRNNLHFTLGIDFLDPASTFREPDLDTVAMKRHLARAHLDPVLIFQHFVCRTVVKARGLRHCWLDRFIRFPPLHGVATDELLQENRPHIAIGKKIAHLLENLDGIGFDTAPSWKPRAPPV